MSNITNTGEYYDYINENLIKNPYIFLAIALVFLFYFFFLGYLGQTSESNSYMNGSESTSSTSETIIKVIISLFILFLIIINALQYVFKIDMSVGISNLSKKIPEIDIKILSNLGKRFMNDTKDIIEKSEKLIDNSGEPLERREVFNIPDNIYSYDDAKAVCSAYDAKLATYNQIEQAYNDGGEWCSYGWSSDQMILYPTQKKTYNKLKTIKGHEHDCGRPGINGGYIGNKEGKFGVNCYGIKPTITHKEKRLMDTNKIYPDSREDRCERKREKNIRKYLKDILISPFNKTSWND